MRIQGLKPQRATFHSGTKIRANNTHPHKLLETGVKFAGTVILGTSLI